VRGRRGGREDKEPTLATTVVGPRAYPASSGVEGVGIGRWRLEGGGP
jgi:hypothetical protein